MPTQPFMAYENEVDSLQINNMTVENRLDRISLYGFLELTKDRQGLEYALKLKQIIDASIDALKRDKNLPDQIKVKKAESIKNPF
ncbi:MAG: hypothetical protein PHQ22_08465 [Sulfuricurvum sp.]|nr:hypothetical protein [Sulfuricurvum sp.]MDD5387210.1 hypothetical protein [Sulfuricurvum sp.]